MSTIPALPRHDKARPSPLHYPDDFGQHPTKGRSTAAVDMSGYGTISCEGTGFWDQLTSPQSPIIQVREHCQQQWVALLMTGAIFIIIVLYVFSLSPSTGTRAGNSSSR